MCSSIYIKIALFLTSIILLFYCSPSSKAPIKIGLMVTLTGKYPELGREIRDGAFLAIDEINKNGGIRGRKLQLLIKDNRGDREVAKSNYLEFINEDVIAVIGPATSSTARAILPLIDTHRLLTISPTVSATEFSFRDDYFISLEPNNRQYGESLGKYVREKLKPKRIIIIADEINPVYTMDFAGSFIKNLDKNTFIKTISFREGITDFDFLIRNALKHEPDLILLVTDAFNSAIITQKIKNLNPQVKIAISPWGKSHAFIYNTGYISEGVFSVGFYDESYKEEKFLNFKDKFIKTFGYSPESYAINGYNAVMLIKEAILKDADRNTIREKILNASFNGLLGEIKINKYGDTETKPFVVIVRNGIFEKLER
ncbi:MAG: ABC transporter substrate-binding protein [Thermodesulfovibrio sp.]|nr:ABC transporter substrate-binding protein [Thermodesulfovibrio sp.]